MELTKQVCSLELAKRLKELGVKQTSYFWWHGGVVGTEVEFAEDSDTTKDYSAFTVAELGEMLPQVYATEQNEKYWLYMSKGATVHTVGYGYAEDNGIEYDHYEEAFTEADARAKMVAYLIENNLLKV